MGHKLLHRHSYPDTLGGVLPPTCLYPDHPQTKASSAQGQLLPPQCKPRYGSPPPLFPLPLGASGTRLLTGHNERLHIRVPPLTRDDAPPCTHHQEPPANRYRGPPDITLHTRALEDAHDQLQPRLTDPHPSSSVSNGQHLFCPKDEGEGSTPRRVVSPLSDPRVLPSHPFLGHAALHGFRQVHRTENPSDDRREEFPGRPPYLEARRSGHLLPPLLPGA